MYDVESEDIEDILGEFICQSYITCRECGLHIDLETEKCPECGWKNPAPTVV